MKFEPIGRIVPQPSFTTPQHVGDANMNSQGEAPSDATLADTAPLNVSVPAVNESLQPLHNSFLPDLSKYDLTVSEALDVFPAEQRRRPSDRTMQRYCQDGRFDCYKLKTTRNGNPVHEWIIDSTSLREFIQTKPVDLEPVNVAPPSLDGDATDFRSVVEPADAATTPDESDDANRPLVLPRSVEDGQSAMATSNQSDDAIMGVRTKVELLIENAEMAARLEAKEELVSELREDKKFLREELTHKRQNDSLIADTYGQVLDTLRAVSVAGRHTKIEIPDANSAGDSDAFFSVDTVTDQTKNQHSDGV